MMGQAHPRNERKRLVEHIEAKRDTRYDAQVVKVTGEYQLVERG